MSEEIILGINIFLLLCSGIGLVYGIREFYLEKAGIFPKLIVCALGCLVLYHLICILLMGVIHGIPIGFHLGVFLLCGAMIFLFCASFGHMDGLVDDGSKSFLKYRILAVAFPLLLLFVMVYVMGKIESAPNRMMLILFCFSIASSSYYHFKHVIIHDVENGIMWSLRTFHRVMLCLEVLYTAAVAAQIFASVPFVLITAVGIGAIYLAMLPILKKGMEQWMM